MSKEKDRKIKWKNFVFTPKGADRQTHGIKYGDDGFMHLCQRLNNGDYMLDYEIYDSAFRPGEGGRSTARDWTGFREALLKHQNEQPPKPSVFSGKYQHCKEGHELRQRMLHAICREYQHPEALADDLWAWLRQGKPEETENLISILVLYYNDPSQRPECRPSASSKTGP